jgi:Adenine-specific methyltransferase EcoRI
MMSSPLRIQSLAQARAAKKDEFYTQLTDIEREAKDTRIN